MDGKLGPRCGMLLSELAPNMDRPSIWESALNYEPTLDMQCSAEAVFLHQCPTNFENDAAKTVPQDIWCIQIFGLGQDFESISYMEYSHAKNNLVFHRNSRSCKGCFDWCIGFLNCTDTSVQQQYVSIIIMKMGTS